MKSVKKDSQYGKLMFEREDRNMVDITVYEGEYEYLIETDPKFRKFVQECEGKTIEEIFRDKFRDKQVCQKAFERTKYV